VRALLSFIYLFVVLLTPWFHLHPGEDHEALTGGLLHSHTEPFASHSPEDDDSEEHIIPHFLAESNNWFDDFVSQSKLTTTNQFQLDQGCIKPVIVFQDQTFGSANFEILVLPPGQVRYVQFATNLSPPNF
jgi:hypothetical protein